MFIYGTVVACVCEAEVMEKNLKLKLESISIWPKDPTSAVKPNLTAQMVQYLYFRTEEMPKSG